MSNTSRTLAPQPWSGLTEEEIAIIKADRQTALGRVLDPVTQEWGPCEHAWAEDDESTLCPKCGTSKSNVVPCAQCGTRTPKVIPLVDRGGCYWYGCPQCWEELSAKIRVLLMEGTRDTSPQEETDADDRHTDANVVEAR